MQFLFQSSNPVEQIPSQEANQEISRPLWNAKIHYYFHKRPSTGHTLRQFNFVHILKPSFLSVILMLSFLLHPSLRLNRIFISRFPTKVFQHLSPHQCVCYIPRQFHPPSFDHISIIQRKAGKVHKGSKAIDRIFSEGTNY